MRHSGLWSLLTIMLLLAAAGSGMAAPLPTISFGVEETAEPTQVATALEVLFVLTVLTIAPAILLMTTSFVRIVVVLSFVRQAMGTQQMPPQPDHYRAGHVSELFCHGPHLSAGL